MLFYSKNKHLDILKTFLPKNISFLRKKLGLKQDELGEKIYVNRGNVGHYEKGKSLPKAETLIKLGKFFNVSIDDLLKKDLEEESILNKSKKTIARKAARTAAGNAGRTR